jgi:tripartite-type tricarboxylate transporter receptor subunit TctC
MSEQLGQSIVIENRVGAGGIPAAVATANAAPNGYTLMYAGSAVLAGNVALNRELPYDPMKSFELIAQTVISPGVLTVHPSIPAKTLAELVAYIKANPGKVRYGSAGIATSQHISGALLASMTNTQMVHVPYKGGVLANNDLVAGRIELVVGPISELLPLIKSGVVVALGVTATKETPLLPGVPPIASVLPGYTVPVWQAIVAPAKTDAAIVDKIHAAVTKALASPTVRAKLGELGQEPIANSPAEFKVVLPKEIEVWRGLIELAGAKPE